MSIARNSNVELSNSPDKKSARETDNGADCDADCSTVCDNPDDAAALRTEVAELRAKAEMYLAIASVLLVVLQMFGLKLDGNRVPDGLDKAKLLRAMKVASSCAPQSRLLNLIGLSPSRYHAWRRRTLTCRLDDESSCPRSQPSRLTALEVQLAD